MNNKYPSLLTIALVLAAGAPAFAQDGYHSSYGNSRVIMQNQTGLYEPSSTYIGAGTLSRSAQGKGAGVGGALPSVNMGSHVRTPGDNLYNNDGTDRQGNGALIYQDQERAIAAMQVRKRQIMMARERAAMRRQMAQQQQQVQGTLYVPGSNGATAGYGNAAPPQMLYHGNGTATYGDNLKSTGTIRNF